jgi:hypothetical protein
MAAVTQIRQRHSEGRAYYEKKLAEGKTGKEALRALKRQISDAIYACLQADPRRAAATSAKSREGNRGTTLHPGRPVRCPDHRLFGQATPEPATHPTTLTAPFPAPLPAREPIMPRSGKGPLDLATKRCSF